MRTDTYGQIAALVAACVLAAVPSTDAAAVAIALPAVVNNPTVQRDFGTLYDIAIQGLEDATGYTAKPSANHPHD